MGIFQDYKIYKQYEPKYSDWEQEKKSGEAKRIEYLKQNPANETVKKKELQRAKALMNAINIMDEYSQSRAENMEIATQQSIGVISTIGSYVGFGLGFLINLTKPAKNLINIIKTKYPKLYIHQFFIPLAMSVITSTLVSMGLQGWATSKEIGASRNGRFEAMKNELADAKNFAVLNDEQLEKQEKIAKTIPTTKDMKKGVVAKQSNLLNIANLFKIVKDMVIKDKKLQQERADFDKKLYMKPDKQVEISEEDMLKAKKDQQLLHNVIEKIDISSQEYSEKVEFATEAILAIGLVNSFLANFLSKSILKLFKVQKPILNMAIPKVAAAAVAIATCIGSVCMQKQASRVGRYIAKKELEKDINNFIYVDENKYNKINKDNKIEQPKEKNIFSFIWQVIKNDIEYRKYVKTQGVENIKKNMALKQIDITDEQLKEAKTLQKNTFKAFNKIDEKSQKYAESIEAVGKVVQIPVITLSSLIGMGLGALVGKKLGKSQGLAAIVGSLLGCIPGIVLNRHFTKEEIKASKIAHMFALDELKDYKNYIDYENLSTPDKTNNSSHKIIKMSDFIKQTSKV